MPGLPGIDILVKYLSVCSGIEAATAAWHGLGWTPVGFAEIEPYASTLLAAHYPTVTNFGDITQHARWNLAPFDLLVGGTPCVGFSVAGLRQGLADPRSNLALAYLGILDQRRPRWFLWENVPGVLSSNSGRDFGTFLGGVAKLGYGFAYRVLDAQYVRVSTHARAVPQRRRRVFVVGYLGDWRRAAEVLLEPEGVRRDPPPRRAAGQGAAADVAPSLVASGRGVERIGETRGQDPVVATCDGNPDGVAPTLMARSSRGGPQALSPGYQTDGHCVMIARPDAVGFYPNEGDRTSGANYDIAPTMKVNAGRGKGGHPPAVAVGFSRGESMPSGFGLDVQPPMRIGSRSGSALPAVATTAVVRRLTPRECERLQGFPDDYTDVPFHGRPAADGHRYRALGNSMAVNVMRWIGERVDVA